VGSPDGTIFAISGGRYTIIDLGSSPIEVKGASEKNYDLVYYEAEYINAGINTGIVYMDNVIVGISDFYDPANPTSFTFYEVLNWGNNDPDTNTNVDTNILPTPPKCSGTPITPECANREISLTSLYPYPGGKGTGILIDVDNAPSAPPVRQYRYLVIICPSGYAEAAEIDSIEITEVPP
jgi:hypothetical protein